MKKVFIIYSENDWHEKEVLKNSPRTRQIIEDWQTRGLRRGLEIYRANIAWYDAKKNVFKKSWTFKNNVWIKVAKPVRPDFILDKLAGKQDYELFSSKLSLAKNAPMINSPLFRTMLGNKLSQYLCLGDFMPKSFLAMQNFDLAPALKKVKTKKVVIKPIYGSGGFGITISEKNKIKNNSIEFPVMIQEFIEGGHGVPGFSVKKELADLRIVFIDHNPIYALSRIAKKGSLFTNFHQGAEVILVPGKALPQSVRILVKKIIQKLSLYPKANYSLDFMFDHKGKPYLIEMNTSPGLDLLQLIGTEQIKDRYFSELFKDLIS